ncbi:MAG TPA: hypothetical protein PK874_08960 [Desulfobacteraceae bacterium]|nr:hypothetical protein [Desulfobacteraceae bacterium]HPJ67801.1 hypothetical protein [Desulfobacteraceae bacterium]HPQ28041.1 hypothetical protein [Desulfobacteraceae bacterium]
MKNYCITYIRQAETARLILLHQLYVQNANAHEERRLYPPELLDI